jgi:hypothetical protein
MEQSIGVFRRKNDHSAMVLNDRVRASAKLLHVFEAYPIDTGRQSPAPPSPDQPGHVEQIFATSQELFPSAVPTSHIRCAERAAQNSHKPGPQTDRGGFVRSKALLSYARDRLAEANEREGHRGKDTNEPLKIRDRCARYIEDILVAHREVLRREKGRRISEINAIDDGDSAVRRARRRSSYYWINRRRFLEAEDESAPRVGAIIP